LSDRNQNMQAESDGLNKRIAHSERAILRRKVARSSLFDELHLDD
jgi:hypothetical protein